MDSRTISVLSFCFLYFVKYHSLKVIVIDFNAEVNKIYADMNITNPTPQDEVFARKIIEERIKKEEALEKEKVEDNLDLEKDNTIHNLRLKLGKLETEKLDESVHRMGAVVLSRLEFLEKEFFPMEYINPINRRTRWWIIFRTIGDPRDEFLTVVEDEYRQYREWQNASQDDILCNFIDFMVSIYPDSSEGPHKEVDPGVLKLLATGGEAVEKLFKIFDIQYVNKNIAGLKAISKDLAMKGSVYKFPAINDVADLRCIFIFHAYDKPFTKGMQFISIDDIQTIFPTRTVISVTPIIGVKSQPIIVPGNLNVRLQKKDKIRVEFSNCNDAIDASNNNYGFIGKDKIKLELDSC